MSIIKVKCQDQTLSFLNTPLIASGGLGEDFMQFEFCSKWDGLERTAVFWRNEKDAYHVLLDDQDLCEIPPEVLQDGGLIYFGAFGVDAAGKQRTTEVLTYRIEQGAITTGTKPSDPTPDIYTQLLEQYAAIVAMYAAKANKVTGAVAGNFAGLDEDGNLTDSGKKPTDFAYIEVSEHEPMDGGPVLWFNTSGINPKDMEAVMLSFGDGDETVKAEVDGEEHGVENATVNTEPEDEGVYDFNIEQ